MSTATESAIFVSVAGGLLFGLATWLLTQGRMTVAKRVRSYVNESPTEGEHVRSLIERALGDHQARQIARSPLMARLRTELEVAEVNMRPEQLLLLVAFATVVTGWLLGTETSSPVAALLGVFIPVLAYVVINTMASRQRRAFSEQLPDNLQVISSSMRAGQTFVGALRAIADDAPDPSGRELHRIVTDEALGVPLADALNLVTERMRCDDFRHVAIVATLQRESGGNTAEVIDLVAETVRERIEIRRMVRSLTAQGRLSGGVLSLMPVGLLMLISLINPGYVHPLFHTTVGLIALGVGMGLVVVGALVMRKIIDVKV